MIHHLSIAAREPERVAGVLAELMGGLAVPDAGNFFAWQVDEHGSGVEVYPAGMELQPNGATGGRFVKSETGRSFGPTHVALSVATDADTVERIARREGWQCFRCKSRSLSRDRSVGRKRNAGRDLAAGIRARIRRLHALPRP